MIQRLVVCAARWPRCKIVTRQLNYLHLIFRTPVFRFIDDVEFFADEEARLLHFRSASRVGYSDLGVNRRRMKKLSRHVVRALSDSAG